MKEDGGLSHWPVPGPCEDGNKLTFIHSSIFYSKSLLDMASTDNTTDCLGYSSFICTFVQKLLMHNIL